ncbi:hypothetical protein DMS07_28090, partial [Klebsiella variicola]
FVHGGDLWRFNTPLSCLQPPQQGKTLGYTVFIINSDSDPDPKSCSIQKQNSGMIMTPLNGGGADEKITIHRRADCFCPQAG